MKSIISLHSGYLPLESSSETMGYQMFEGTFDLRNLIENPLSKVYSVIEILGGVKIAALSMHCCYLAIIKNSESTAESVLHIFYLKSKRYKAVRKFQSPCSLLHYHTSCENLLFIGLKNYKLHLFDVENELWTDLVGHELSPVGVFHEHYSGILLSWSGSEILTWEWPSCDVTKRLRVNSKWTVKLAGEAPEDKKIFAAFNSGIVLLWDLKLPSYEETIIQLPEGIDMEFNAFSLSIDGEWLVGGGSQPMLVIYSLKCARVVQVVHLPQAESFLEINDVMFLPTSHPQFSKSFLLATSGSILISDLTTSTIIKTLKSQQYPISNICVSRDGILLGITYDNGTTKIYALSAFYPPLTKKLVETSENTLEVSFKVLKADQSAVKIKSKMIQREKIKSLLDSSKWIQILEEFGEFPERYRKYIWASLMQLPKNFSVFSCLLKKEESNHFPLLAMQFPEASQSFLQTFKNILSCLCYWTPALCSIDVLPAFLFPFIEFFEENPLLCFEMSVILISNWFRLWIEQSPATPKFMVIILDQLICDTDPKLWMHFQKVEATPTHYIYPLIFTSFSKILCKSDWCKLWDHILSKPPTFFLCTIAAFVLILRQSLLLCKDSQMIKNILIQENWIQVKEVLKKSKKLFIALEMDSLVREKIDYVTFIPKGDLIPLNIKVNEDHFFQDSTLCEMLSNINFNNCNNKMPLKSSSNVGMISSNEKFPTSYLEPKLDLSLGDHREVLKRGNDCLKRVNNIRKKQVLKFT